MSKYNPRIMVLTLYFGEAEYDACKESVRCQVEVEVEHKCFEWMPNERGHKAIYQEIMERSDEFDAFLKLDADMTLIHPESLIEAYRIMVECPGTDHLSIPVYDHPSGKFLMGFHLFSCRASWTFPLDPVFPDENPEVPGISRIDSNLKRRIISHMTCPSVQQAYRLGVHRALKILKNGQKFQFRQSRSQLRYLRRVAANHSFDTSLRYLVLLGMFETIMLGAPNFNYKSAEVSTRRLGLSHVLACAYVLCPFRWIIYQFLYFRYVHLRRFLALFYS